MRMPTLYWTLSLFLTPAALGATWDPSRYAWYTDGAADFASALPIGNGRLGAAVFGTALDKIVLNENSVWSGPWQDRANAASKNAVSGIRQMLAAGNISTAGQTALSSMSGNPTSPRAYNPLVNLGLDFGHSANSLSSYTRWLDTYRGIAGVSYVQGGVNYRLVGVYPPTERAGRLTGVTCSREYIGSYEHGILAFRLTANQTGKLSVKVSLSRSQWVLSQTASVSSGGEGLHSLALSGNSGQDGGAITFWSEARVGHAKGECQWGAGARASCPVCPIRR